jgi:hypothetical protein
MANARDQVRQLLQTKLDAGETLQGIVGATRQKVFTGSLFAIGVTDRRLLLQPLDRRHRPKGEPRSIPPEALAGVDFDDAQAPLAGRGMVIALSTADGEELRLTIVEGRGLIGKLAGGEAQEEGIRALGEWLRARGMA